MPKHVDHSNVKTFEVGNLEVLIKQATSDSGEVDKRRKEFKEYEIEKKYERRVALDAMAPEACKAAEEQHA